MPIVDEGIPPDQWLLSTQGYQATRELAARLRNHSFDFILSSPEPKAWQTAEILASELGERAVEATPQIVEHKRSSIGFLTRSDLERGIAKLFAKPDKIVFGDESADCAFARFCSALANYSRSTQKDMLVVSHGTIISIYTSRIASVNGFTFWQSLRLPAAVILERGKIRVVDPMSAS